MREATDQLNQDRPQRDFLQKIGLHRGESIAGMLNERLDYFGQTVNIAARATRPVLRKTFATRQV
jgi:class 3 adenylate cyclase